MQVVTPTSHQEGNYKVSSAPATKANRSPCKKVGYTSTSAHNIRPITLEKPKEASRLETPSTEKLLNNKGGLTQALLNTWRPAKPTSKAPLSFTTQTTGWKTRNSTYVSGNLSISVAITVALAGEWTKTTDHMWHLTNGNRFLTEWYDGGGDQGVFSFYYLIWAYLPLLFSLSLFLLSSSSPNL